MCPSCGKPPMSSKLKWTLLSFIAIVVLAVLSMRGGDPVDPNTKKPPVAAAPN
jgi:hypothetical protein